MRRSVLLLGSLAAALAGSVVAQEHGLSAAADALGGPFWQVRFERDSGSALPGAGLNALLPLVAAPQTLRLLGDYQFGALRLGSTGGLRLTGGLLINLRPASLGLAITDIGSALPYAGIGYASSGSHGNWGFSADLGLAAQGLGPQRLDRLLGGNTGLNLDGSPRLLPMVRLGMNLAF